MPDAETRPLVVALPKGRVMGHALDALAKAGLSLKLADDDRRLRHETPEGTVLVMRNADVPTYVDLGVADVGVVGKDVLLESGRRLYEPVDLGIAHCRMSLIRPRGTHGTLNRIASKYPRIAASYAAEQGHPAEIVPLKGNVELACLSGLADAVVDVVETGATLTANDLEEVDVIFESTARFVVNRAALKLRASQLRPLIARLREGAKS